MEYREMMYVKTCALMLVLLFSLAGMGCASDSSELVRDEWLSEYWGTVKLGYTHRLIQKGDVQGRQGYIVNELSNIMVNVPGADMSSDEQTWMTVKHALQMDLQFHPLSESYMIRSAFGSGEHSKVHTESIETRFQTDLIECVDTQDGKTTKRSVPTRPGADLSRAYRYKLGFLDLTVGDKIGLDVFDPRNCTYLSWELEVPRTEEIRTKEGVADVLVVLRKSPTGKTMSWRLRGGREVKSKDLETGNIRVSEGRDEAITSPNDRSFLPGGITADKQIADPTRVRKLEVRLLDFWDKSLVIDDIWQSAKPSLTGESVDFVVTTSEYDSRQSAKLPIDAKDLSEWTRPSQGIESDDGPIKGLSARIIGSEDNAYVAASKLRLWVFDNLKDTSKSDIPFSAKEILKGKAGDCVHGALLFTALARASGIPTRLAGGLIYRKGMFRAHMWAECFVGEWVPIDPSARDDFVDATHIKLLQDVVTEGLPFVASRAEIGGIEYLK